MKPNSRLRLPFVAVSAVSATVIACAGEVEELGYTHVIDPSEVERFDANESLESIQDVAVAVSGEVWALQRTNEPHLFVYSADGDLHDSFAATGSGRNQLRNPYGLLPTDDSQFPMAVWDAGNRRVSQFNPYGRASVVQVYRSRGQVYAEIESHSYGAPLDMARLGENYILMDHSNGLHVTADYLRSELLRLGPRGELVDTLVDFEAEFADSIAEMGSEVNYLAPIPVWASCPDGELVVLNPFTRTLRWYDTDGNVARREELSIPAREVSEADQETFLLRRFDLQWRETRADEPDTTVLENSVEDFMLRHWDQFSETAPPAVAMICAAGHEVWLQEFDTEDHALGLGSRWLVHNPESTDLVYVQFPKGFRPKTIVDGTVYGVVESDEGTDVVARITLPEQIEAPASAEH